MAENVLKSYLISLGFKEVGGSEFKRSLKDYEAAVVQAEKAIEDARWAGAKSQEEIAKVTRDTNLRLAREALAKAQEVKKAEEEAAKRRKAEMAEAAKGLQSLALAAAAAAAAIGYAMAKIAANFSQLHYQSERTGASVSSMKALGYAFEQTGSSAAKAGAALDKFTTGQRNNPGLRQFVKDLGVGDGLAPAEKLLATVAAIQAKAGGDRAIGHQYAELLGISEEDYDHLVRQGAAVADYARKFEDASRRMGVNQDDVADKAVKFSRAVGRVSMQVEVLASALAAKLLPPLTKVIEAFSAWIDSNPGALDRILKTISKTLVEVAEGISAFLKAMSGDDGDEFIKRWGTIVDVAKSFKFVIQSIVFLVGKLIDGLGLVVSGTRQVLQFLRLMPGGSDPAAMLNALSGGTAVPNGPGGSNTGNAVPPDDRTTWEKYAPKALGGKDAPQAGDGSRAWRNNNPGNIKMGDFARGAGATEADDKGFAKFPSYEAGRKAQEKLLFESAGYKDKTIAEAIQRWAPGSDGNDPAGYAQILAKAAGVDVNTKLADLNSEQRGRLLDAQQRKEGWTPGIRDADLTTSGPVRANLMHGQYGGVGENLTTLRSASGLRTQVHSEAQPSFAGFIKELEAQGYKIDSLGGFNDRNVRGGDRKSQHAYGNAIDLNPGKNPLGTSITDMPDNVRALAKKYGLIWGADWKGRKDPMHFEWNGTRPWLDEEKRRAETPTVPRAGSATRPSMTPGGFDPNGTMRPSTPAGIGPGSISNATSNDNRAVHQTFNSTTTVNGAERPEATAAAVGRADRDNHALAMANAQRAIA